MTSLTAQKLVKEKYFMWHNNDGIHTLMHVRVSNLPRSCCGHARC